LIFQSDRALYIVTEPVVPLSTYLDSNDAQSPSIQLAISWGLYQLVVCLHFCSLWRWREVAFI